MSLISLEFVDVWKKFKKGEKYDSLRDLIPAATKLLFSGNRTESLEESEFWAVKGVSFELKKGEALGVIGPNGAGKSTILKLFSGILKPDRGRIDVRGRLSALIEVGAGFHPDLTGRENIFLNATILGMKRDEIKRKFDAIVDFSGLSEFIDTPVKRYSSGMFARLGFSISAHVEPEILLIDEVLSVGDISFQQKCLNKMQEIVQGGTTIIFVSHNIPSVIKLCPTTLLLNRGEIQKLGESKEVCRHYYRAYAETQQVSTDESLEIGEIHFTGREGKKTTAFTAGDWVKGEMTVECRSDHDNLVMGFFIKDGDGMVVFDANSDKFSGKYFSFRRDENQKVAFDFRVNLPEGTYYMGIHFMNEAGEFSLYRDEICEFYVNGPKSMGSAYLDTRW